MEHVLDMCLTPTQDMIVNLMEIENGNINTNHPDFVGAADSLLNLFQDDQTANDSSKNRDGDENQDKTYSLLSKRKPQTQGQSQAHDPQQSDRSHNRDLPKSK